MIKQVIGILIFIIAADALKMQMAFSSGDSAVKAIDECIDDPRANCHLVVRVNRCGNRNYEKKCCKSCKVVNQEENKKEPTTTKLSLTTTESTTSTTTTSTSTASTAPTTKTTKPSIKTDFSVLANTTEPHLQPTAVPVILEESSKLIVAVMIFSLMLVAIVIFGLRCNRKKSTRGYIAA